MAQAAPPVEIVGGNMTSGADGRIIIVRDVSMLFRLRAELDLVRERR